MRQIVSLALCFSEVGLVQKKCEPLQRFTASRLRQTAEAVGEIRGHCNTQLEQGVNETIQVLARSAP